MPDYPLTSLRHPVNVARLIHQAALIELGSGATLKVELWNDLVALTANVNSRSAINNLTDELLRRRMIRRPERGTIQIMPREGAILPAGWSEPASSWDTTTAVLA